MDLNTDFKLSSNGCFSYRRIVKKKCINCYLFKRKKQKFPIAWMDVYRITTLYTKYFVGTFYAIEHFEGV